MLNQWALSGLFSSLAAGSPPVPPTPQSSNSLGSQDSFGAKNEKVLSLSTEDLPPAILLAFLQRNLPQTGIQITRIDLSGPPSETTIFDRKFKRELQFSQIAPQSYDLDPIFAELFAIRDLARLVLQQIDGAQLAPLARVSKKWQEMVKSVPVGLRYHQSSTSRVALHSPLLLNIRASLPKLRALSIHSIPFPVHFPELEALTTFGSGELMFREHTKLTSLSNGTVPVANLAVIKPLTNLERIKLSCMPPKLFFDIPTFLTSFRSLKHLHFDPPLVSELLILEPECLITSLTALRSVKLPLTSWWMSAQSVRFPHLHTLVLVPPASNASVSLTNLISIDAAFPALREVFFEWKTLGQLMLSPLPQLMHLLGTQVEVLGVSDTYAFCDVIHLRQLTRLELCNVALPSSLASATRSRFESNSPAGSSFGWSAMSPPLPAVLSPSKPKAVPLDKCFPHQENHRVLVEDDAVWDCELHKMAIAGEGSTNKFFVLQLVVSDDNTQWFVFERWGSIGQKGEFKIQQIGTVDLAKDVFRGIFASKTGNNWANRSNFTPLPGEFFLARVDWLSHPFGLQQPRQRAAIEDLSAISELSFPNLQHLELRQVTNAKTVLQLVTSTLTSLVVLLPEIHSHHVESVLTSLTSLRSLKYRLLSMDSSALSDSLLPQGPPPFMQESSMYVSSLPNRGSSSALNLSCLQTLTSLTSLAVGRVCPTSVHSASVASVTRTLNEHESGPLQGLTRLHLLTLHAVSLDSDLLRRLASLKPSLRVLSVSSFKDRFEVRQIAQTEFPHLEIQLLSAD